jgi:hypothetical protein
MFVTVFALFTAACVGLLFGRFLSATYRVDLWPAALAAIPVITALLLIMRPKGAAVWLWLGAATWVNASIAFPFLALLFVGREPQPAGLGQMAALAAAAGLATIVALVAGTRHLRRIGISR